jgi:hypothetical protein
MNKKIEEQRFEFVLYINKHIICQRYFSIRDYNEQSLKSLELKALMDRIAGVNASSMGVIPSHLKKKSIDYLWRFYNPYNKQTEVSYRNNYEKEDTFDFEIRVDREVVAQSTFSGNFFPPQIRYQVDIKELIPNIIADIKDTLSQKKYTRKYANATL